MTVEYVSWRDWCHRGTRLHDVLDAGTLCLSVTHPASVYLSCSALLTNWRTTESSGTRM